MQSEKPQQGELEKALEGLAKVFETNQNATAVKVTITLKPTKAQQGK